VVALIIAPVAAALDRVQGWKFLLPVAQHVRLDRTQLADLANGEVALGRDCRPLCVIARIQHSLPPSPSVSAPAGTSPRGARKWESPRRSWGCAPASGSCRAGRNCRTRRV